VRIPAAAVELAGDLVLPEDAFGIVLFAHGSGSGKGSPRNRAVAAFLHEAGLATLLVDLLTEEEAAIDDSTAEHRFDIDLLAERVGKAAEWLAAAPETRQLAQGYYGASTGAAAALVAAAEHPELARAVVSRGGRPDLADAALPRVQSPTLLIVGGDDTTVLDLNRRALAAMHCRKKLEIIPGATHLFPEPGAMSAVSRLARRWFVEHLGVPGASNS
ncbi:MAG: dienelactone hydrolase family protein, partial [Candidatus Binatia bacterium]